MAKIDPRKIEGAWKAGIALDQHTISSTYTGVNEYGHGSYNSQRTELGALMYRLKYRADRTAAPEIIETAASYLRRRLAEGIRLFDMIILVPHSSKRVVQPVPLLADGIGRELGIPVNHCMVPTREAGQLKDVNDPARRSAMLDGLYQVDPAITENKHILLFDDLFRSGATMNAITNVLLKQGMSGHRAGLDDNVHEEERMKTVFVGGSRHVSRLTQEAKERLSNIVGNGFLIVVGDAAGADKAVQQYLRDVSYPNVIVFCSGEHPRNNLGQWRIHKVSTHKAQKGFQFFAAKDREMAKEADFGLMIWDGKSPGTALNVLRLVRAGKKAVLLKVQDKQTVTFKSLSDWENFIAGCDTHLVEDLRSRATPEEWKPPVATQAAFLETLETQVSDERSPTVAEKTDDELTAEINEAFAKGDWATVVEAIGTLAKSRGMTQVAKESGLARESLYRSLNSGGNPEFLTVLKVMSSIGLRLTVKRESVHR